MPTQPLTPAQALAKAEELCAISEQCEADIRTRLIRWGISRSDADSIIDRLIEHRYIDDRRFAAAYVRDKLNHARWGCRKILAALAAKHISRRIATEALDNEFDGERYAETLFRILRTKARNMERPLSRDDRMRLARFAVNRGFETGIILDTIRDIARDIDID